MAQQVTPALAGSGLPLGRRGNTTDIAICNPPFGWIDPFRAISCHCSGVSIVDILVFVLNLRHPYETDLPITLLNGPCCCDGTGVGADAAGD